MSREGEMAAAAYLANSLSSASEKDAHYAEVRRLQKQIDNLNTNYLQDRALRLTVEAALMEVAPDHPMIFNEDLRLQAFQIGRRIAEIHGGSKDDVRRHVNRFVEAHKANWPTAADVQSGSYQPAHPVKQNQNVMVDVEKISVDNTPPPPLRFLIDIFRSEESIKARAEAEIEGRKNAEIKRRENISKALDGLDSVKISPMPTTAGLHRKPFVPHIDKSN
jgi:hypothetical protein